jgi:hypothetical protein
VVEPKVVAAPKKEKKEKKAPAKAKVGHVADNSFFMDLSRTGIGMLCLVSGQQNHRVGRLLAHSGSYKW